MNMSPTKPSSSGGAPGMHCDRPASRFHWWPIVKHRKNGIFFLERRFQRHVLAELLAALHILSD